MKKIKKIGLGFASIALCGLVVTSVASTAVLAADKSCGTETAILHCDKQTGIWGILLLVLNILSAGVGIVAVGGFIYAAVLYTSASDNASQLQKAKEVMRNVVIGVIAYALMFAFLQFLIPGGVFKTP